MSALDEFRSDYPGDREDGGYIPRTRYSSGVTEEQKQGISEGFKKTGKFLTDVYQDTKEFRDWRNPLNYGANIGAAALRAGENFVSFDATNPQEVMLETVDKLATLKQPWSAVAKEIPAVADNLKILGRKRDEALLNAGEFLGIRPKPLQESVVGINDDMLINPRQDMDLAELSARPLEVGYEQSLSTRTDNFKGLVEQDASQKKIIEFLERGPGGAISPQYTNRPGYFTSKKLAAQPEVIEDLFTRNENIKNLQKNYLEKLSRWQQSPSNSRQAAKNNAQRAWYDEVSRNIFSDEALVYGKDKPRQIIAGATKWITGAEWHHIFGNKEAGEFLLSQVAQDPLVAANLMAHLKHIGLNSSGIATNIAIFKKIPHQNFHKWLRDMGFEGSKYSPLSLNQFGSEISKYITEGVQTTAQIGEKGRKLKPKFYPPEPEAVNDLFGLLEYYAEATKFMKEQIRKGKVVLSDGTVLSLSANGNINLPAEIMSELKSKKVSGLGSVLKSGELMKQIKVGTRGRKRNKKS